MKVSVHNENFFREHQPGQRLVETAARTASPWRTANSICRKSRPVKRCRAGKSPPDTRRIPTRNIFSASATIWPEANRVVSGRHADRLGRNSAAMGQAPVRPAHRRRTAPATFAEDAASTITLKAKDVTAVIDKSRGILTSIRQKDQEWLRFPAAASISGGPPPTTTRARKLHHKLKIWQYAGSRPPPRK